MTETTEISQDSTAFEQLNILLESIEQHPDERVRDHVRALVYTLLDLHHGALKRIVEIVSAQPAGEKILRELTGDDLVQAVLMVHELMAQPLETRIENALDIAREQLKIYGANVELVEVKEGLAKLKLIGSAATANVSSSILKGEIEQALHENVPDLLNVEYEDLIAVARPAKLVQILPRQNLHKSTPKENFMPIIRTDQVPLNELRVVETGGINLLLCNVAGTIYAFQNACAHENLPLEKGLLEGGVLTCPWHGYQYDVRQGGRCLTDPNLRLESLPAKVENNVVKVALSKEV